MTAVVQRVCHYAFEEYGGDGTRKKDRLNNGINKTTTRHIPMKIHPADSP
jgi:hypothetical protein